MSPLSEPTKLILARSYVGIDDPDAAAYIAAVEAADGQPLEISVQVAIHSFVKGCKADSIWSAIRASCILAGARTLAGALVPLVGTAPTNFNFVSGDYNRKTGLIGNGSTKYINSNRAANADPQNNAHVSVYVSTPSSGVYAGAVNSGGTSGTQIVPDVSGGGFLRLNSSISLTVSTFSTALGLVRVSRSLADQLTRRIGSSTVTASNASTSPAAEQIHIFQRNFATTNTTSARLAFYSIGESLDLTLLDARVTTLINAFAAAIP